MRSKSSFRAVVLAVLLATSTASAAREIQGDWSGKIQGVRLVLHVQHAAGGYAATLDSPDQGAMGIPIDTLSLAGDSVRFQMSRLGAVFAGRLSAAGDSLAGQWSQSGMTLPLAFARGSGAAAARPRQEAWPPYPYDTLEVSVPNPNAAGVTLAGTLTLPRGKGPFPAEILITGSGPEDRDETVFGHRPFRVLADHLTRHGVAVLRLDDRGVGRSTGRFAGATSEDFAGDILASVAFLRGRSEIAPRQIGLIGHSEGGLIAPIVANRSRDVSYVVLMAGPGIPGDSLLMLQSALLRGSMGVDDAALAQERAVSRRLYTAARRGDSVAVIAAAHELVRLQLAGLPVAQRRAVGDPDSIAAAAIRLFWSPSMRFMKSPGWALMLSPHRSGTF